MSHNLLSKTGLQYFWGKLKAYFAKGNGRVFYGTCSTAGGTGAKIVECPSFTSADLDNGTIILVKFTNTNSAAVDSLTLNVNSTGAVDIKKIYNYATSNLSNVGELRAITHQFIYWEGASSSHWYLVGVDYNTNTTYSAMTQDEIDAGTGTTGRRITPKLLRDNFYTESEVDALIAGIGDTPVATTQPSGGMLPNVVYDLGTLTGTVTFSLASPTDNTIANPYHWTFETGGTAPTITWPSGLTWAGGSAPTINASKHYEIMVRNDYATSLEF